MFSKEHESSRSKVNWFLFGVGALITLWALPNIIVEVEGTKRAGGAVAYLGVSRWQDHARFSFWGFSFPIASALLLMGMALRHNIPRRLAIGVPLTVMGMLVYVGYVLSFPTVVPAYFGIAGMLNAVSVLIIVLRCASHIRKDDPWPGLLRGVGYVSFNATAWFTCGLLSTPGGVVYANIERSQTVITDLAHKISAAWTLSWMLTAAGYLLEWRAASRRSRAATPLADKPLSVTSEGPAFARAAQVGAPAGDHQLLSEGHP